MTRLASLLVLFCLLAAPAGGREPDRWPDPRAVAQAELIVVGTLQPERPQSHSAQQHSPSISVHEVLWAQAGRPSDVPGALAANIGTGELPGTPQVWLLAGAADGEAVHVLDVAPPELDVDDAKRLAVQAFQANPVRVWVDGDWFPAAAPLHAVLTVYNLSEEVLVIPAFEFGEGRFQAAPAVRLELIEGDWSGCLTALFHPRAPLAPRAEALAPLGADSTLSVPPGGTYEETVDLRRLFTLPEFPDERAVAYRVEFDIGEWQAAAESGFFFTARRTPLGWAMDFGKIALGLVAALLGLLLVVRPATRRLLRGRRRRRNAP